MIFLPACEYVDCSIPVLRPRVYGHMGFGNQRDCSQTLWLKPVVCVFQQRGPGYLDGFHYSLLHKILVIETASIALVKIDDAMNCFPVPVHILLFLKLTAIRYIKLKRITHWMIHHIYYT